MARAEKLKSLGSAAALGIALCLAWALSANMVTRIDELKTADWDKDELTYLPSGKLLKPMVLGFDEAAAALIWVKSILYYADAYLNHQNYQWLGHMLDIVTTLNPRFKPAYDFGGVILTKQVSEIPKTLVLLERGIAEYPDDWQLRVSAALARVKLDSNYLLAAEYLKPLAIDTLVPVHIRNLAATFLEKGGGDRMALAFLVGKYLQVQNAMQREVILEKMSRLYSKGPNISLPDLNAKKTAIQRILEPMLARPNLEMIALQVLHEYLSGEVSPSSRQLLDKLGIP